MGDNKGKGKIFKKESKTIIFTKKTRGILMLLKGGGGGLNSKVCFWKISVNAINTDKREFERLN